LQMPVLEQVIVAQQREAEVIHPSEHVHDGWASLPPCGLE